MYLLFDVNSPDYYIARRSADELKPEIIDGLEVGDVRMVNENIGVIRES